MSDQKVEWSSLVHAAGYRAYRNLNLGFVRESSTLMLHRLGAHQSRSAPECCKTGAECLILIIKVLAQHLHRT